jgi:defect-in-organelle-trafficking protein DotA
MRNRWIFWLLALCPLLAMADSTTSSMSFAPPASDSSVVFLGNLFGVVDGVLSGTGSQMMGKLMGTFNAAVLALGGIVVMYIILVSTMNTAHEGEMLGHKWSSIWVPIRTTIGLALLVPKASGYCLMQIFVMWVVVQGVGLADKLWNTALNYMNVGGVIIQENMNPNTSLNAGGGSISDGAAIMLYGQVCMYGLQNQLETARTNYLNQLNSGTGPCAGTPNATMQAFCNDTVPDFISSVDPLSIQSNQGSTGPYTAPMPNFAVGSTYAPLNGICGSIQWAAVDTSSLSSITSLTTEDIDMVAMTRAMAVSQMYYELVPTSQKMVTNDPQIFVTTSTETFASSVAVLQFGVPYTSAGVVCASNQTSSCTMWGLDPSSQQSVMFLGTEFQDAIADYNAVMAPTLNLISESENSASANSARAFIENSEQQGWIMAGSYFYNLVTLNGSAASSTTTDTDSGLGNSAFSISTITGAYGSNGGCSASSPYVNLCTYLLGNITPVNQVVALINGSENTTVTAPNTSANTINEVPGTGASTAYGYVTNGMIIQLPGQPGKTTAAITSFTFDFDTGFSVGSSTYTCHYSFMGICFDLNVGMFAYIFGVVGAYILAVVAILQTLAQLVIVDTISGFMYIFQQGMSILTVNGVNPILALAQMGVTYINFSMNITIAITVAAAAAAMFTIGTPVLVLLMCVSPLLFAWLGVMVGIGFITAYYIPFLPYMLFTFGSIAWLIAVIEAMVAAPIVALGVAHPEGGDALGKSEQGLMILLNIFLRPGLMVVGYISGIALCYVGVWVINEGFQSILTGIQPTWAPTGTIPWTQFYGYFFGSLIYTTMYLAVVQQAFTLIAVLPDKVLRWIGSQAETAGSESSKWSDEAKGTIKEASDKTKDAGAQTAKQIGGYGGDALGAAVGKGKGGGSPAVGNK